MTRTDVFLTDIKMSRAKQNLLWLGLSLTAISIRDS